MTELPIYLTDRSRAECYQSCRRKRFWAYEYQGRGLQRKGLSVPLTVGIWTHHGLTYLLEAYLPNHRGGQRLLDSEELIELAVKDAVEGYQAQVDERGFSLDQIGDPTSPMLYVIQEQKALIEANIRLFAKVALKELLEEYEVLAVEEDNLWQMAEGLGWMWRSDAILRRRRTGGLVPLEFKTTYAWNELVEQQHRGSNQGLSSLPAIEERFGEKVEAIKYIFIVKGSYSGRSSPMQGCKSYDNLLIHPFKLADPTGLGEATYHWDNLWNCSEPHRLGNGRQCLGGKRHYIDRDNLRRCSIWEEPLGVKGWLEQVPLEVLNQMVARPMNYIRDEREVADWLESTRFQELYVAESALEVAYYAGADQRFTLNEQFPMNRQACFDYNSRCAYFSLCHEGANPETLGDGEFIFRQPHHAAEQHQFMEVENERT